MNYQQPLQSRNTVESIGIDAKQSPMLFQQIAMLEKSIYALQESLHQLNERLLPISVAVPAEPIQEKLAAQTRATSPITDKLRELENVLWGMTRRMQAQLESMDL